MRWCLQGARPCSAPGWTGISTCSLQFDLESPSGPQLGWTAPQGTSGNVQRYLWLSHSGRGGATGVLSGEARGAADHPTVRGEPPPQRAVQPQMSALLRWRKPEVPLNLKGPWAVQRDTQETAGHVMRSASVSHLHQECSGCPRRGSVRSLREEAARREWGGGSIDDSCTERGQAAAWSWSWR